MRGKAGAFRDSVTSSRITPAYAGKSAGQTPASTADKDHPRLCGEKRIWDGINSLVTGSPPPMRGKACGFTRS